MMLSGGSRVGWVSFDLSVTCSLCLATLEDIKVAPFVSQEIKVPWAGLGWDGRGSLR